MTVWDSRVGPIGWLRLVGSLKTKVSFAKEPYKRDYILQKIPMISRSLLIIATPSVPNWGFIAHLEQTLSWVFTTEERKKEFKNIYT